MTDSVAAGREQAIVVAWEKTSRGRAEQTQSGGQFVSSMSECSHCYSCKIRAQTGVRLACLFLFGYF